MSRPSRGAWIEIFPLKPLYYLSPSRPSRGAWIEMQNIFTNFPPLTVAPLAGRVD